MQIKAMTLDSLWPIPQFPNVFLNSNNLFSQGTAKQMPSHITCLQPYAPNPNQNRSSSSSASGLYIQPNKAIDTTKMAAAGVSPLPNHLSTLQKPPEQPKLTPVPSFPPTALRSPQTRLDQNLHLPRPQRPNSRRITSLQKTQR